MGATDQRADQREPQRAGGRRLVDELALAAAGQRRRRLPRRDFLRLGASFAAASLVGSPLWQRALAGQLGQGGPGPYGPLGDPDANGIRLPAGFQSRLIAESGTEVADTGFQWHVQPDGGEVFPTEDGGWVYVSNAEFFLGEGVGAVRFDIRGEIVDAYRICADTSLNCAGGKTPWQTWLTCEERPDGLVWECDPLGVNAQVSREAMGRFMHEAVAVDPIRRQFYLTEDEPNGGFYRFTPDVWGDLGAGVLEIAEVVGDGPDGDVIWHVVPEPNPDIVGGGTPTRQQVDDWTRFDGGEGIVWSRRMIYFTTKGDNRVWQYDPETASLCRIYEAAQDPSGQLSGVDNITASAFGDLIVAEDGGNMELVVLTSRGVAAPLLQVVGQVGSELTGPAFDPYERRLYFSSQRGGPNGWGMTYEVTGPFRMWLHC